MKTWVMGWQIVKLQAVIDEKVQAAAKLLQQEHHDRRRAICQAANANVAMGRAIVREPAVFYLMNRCPRRQTAGSDAPRNTRFAKPAASRRCVRHARSGREAMTIWRTDDRDERGSRRTNWHPARFMNAPPNSVRCAIPFGSPSMNP
jgi:hypothetical protein